MSDGWVAVVSGQTVPIESLADLRSVLTRTVGLSRQELWLESPRGPCVCMLRSAARALLMFLREQGDVGFTSRADDDMSGPGTLEFTLANGQVEDYPAAWTVSAERAREALEHFFQTGAMAPFVAWNDDSADKEE
jgi:hypothetical protein